MDLWTTPGPKGLDNWGSTLNALMNISSQFAWQGVQSAVGFLLIVPTLNFFQKKVYMFKTCKQNVIWPVKMGLIAFPIAYL